MSSSSRSSSARCQASRSVVAVSASATSAIAAAQASIVFGELSASSAACRRSTSSAKRPASSIAAVDVVERKHVLEQPLLVLGHGDADEHPVEARRQVFAASAPSLKGSRCSASRPQRMPLAATHSSMRARSSSSK
jgi:hypothetical protein